MTESNKPKKIIPPKTTQPIGFASIIMLIASILMCLISANICHSAISWKHHENYASLFYVLVGIPFLVLQGIFGLINFLVFRRSSLLGGIASLIPLLVSILVAIVYFRNE